MDAGDAGEVWSQPYCERAMQGCAAAAAAAAQPCARPAQPRPVQADGTTTLQRRPQMRACTTAQVLHTHKIFIAPLCFEGLISDCGRWVGEHTSAAQTTACMAQLPRPASSSDAKQSGGACCAWFRQARRVQRHPRLAAPMPKIRKAPRIQQREKMTRARNQSIN